MGAEKIEAAVIDAGPLIHLAEVQCLSVLGIFEILHLPDAVWNETVEQGRVSAKSVFDLGNTQRVSVPSIEVESFIKKYQLENLHTGERECLYLCQQSIIPIILTDDLAVREASISLHIRPVGSLGIVVRAYREGLFSLKEAESYILDLQEASSLFVTKSIVEIAIKQLNLSS